MLVATIRALALRLRRAFLDRGLRQNSGRTIAPLSLDQRHGGQRSVGGRTGVRALRYGARIVAAIGHHDHAASLLSFAVRRRPDDPRLWVQLGDELSLGGPIGPKNLTLLGVTAQPIGNLKAAAAAYRRADLISPSADTKAAVGRSLFASGSLEDAVHVVQDALAEFPGDPALLTLLARCLSESGRRRGGLTRAQVDELTGTWQAVTACDGPLRQRARYHLIRHAIRYEDWPTAFEMVSRERVSTPTIEELSSEVSDPCADRSPDWWYVASWRLRAAGKISTGEQARRREALVRIDQPLPVVPTLESIRERTQALVVLGRLDEALALIERSRRIPDPSGRLTRLAADLAIRRGDPAPLVDWSLTHPTGLPVEPEHRFRELVGASAVGILGPNAVQAERDDLAHRCDVVIETKRLAAVGKADECPRIAYYADTSAALFDDSIMSLLDREELQLAVFRPTSAASHGRLSGDARLRIMPTEDSLSAGVSHYGIARIVYDVLRVSPRTITLAGVDMFTSQVRYPESYTTDLTAYDAAAFVRVLPGFNHDLADDHAMLSALLSAGVIDADRSTSQILALELVDYLRLLDDLNPD